MGVTAELHLLALFLGSLFPLPEHTVISTVSPQLPVALTVLIFPGLSAICIPLLLVCSHSHSGAIHKFDPG